MSGLSIPTRNVGGWAAEIVQQCSASLEQRRQQCAIFRNLFLTSTPRGAAATYPLIGDHVLNHAANLYSPAELNLHVAPYVNPGPRDLAIGRACAAHLMQRMREGEVDTLIDDSIIWSLVYGKMIGQILWTPAGGLNYNLVTPEVFGVMRDDKSSLDEQDAFFHSSWMTSAQFEALAAQYKNATELVRVQRNSKTAVDDASGPPPNVLRTILVGAAYGQPYQNAGGASTGRNLVDWYSAPEPSFSARTLADLVRLDELWVRDYQRHDWITFQLVGNNLLTPEDRPPNFFADAFGPADPARINPLKGKHPFVEFCPNRIKDWFWGISECAKVALLQEAIEKRVAGIDNILRHEEDPTTYFRGTTGMTSAVYTRLKRPGSYFSDASPGAQVPQQLGPKVTPEMWQSLHEYEAMFEHLGMTDVLRGRGAPGVRAQGHAETLVRTGSARLRRPAFSVKRSVEGVAGLAFDLCRAQEDEELIFEVPVGDLGPFAGKELPPEIFEPSATGRAGVPFLLALVSDRFKVSLPGLRGAPAFAKDEEATDFALAARGVMSPADLAMRSGVPDADELVAGIEQREAAQAALLKAHPELLKVLEGGKKR